MPPSSHVGLAQAERRRGARSAGRGCHGVTWASIVPSI